jgi:thiamine monophosphate kinase
MTTSTVSKAKKFLQLQSSEATLLKTTDSNWLLTGGKDFELVVKTKPTAP